MDEIDSIAPGRSTGGNGSGNSNAAGDMSARIIATLLTLMDGIGGA